MIANSTVEGGPGEGGWLCKYETTDAAGKFIQEPIYHNSNDDCKWDTNIGNVNKSPNKDQINRYSDYKLMIELENHVKESLEKLNKNPLKLCPIIKTNLLIIQSFTSICFKKYYLFI